MADLLGGGEEVVLLAALEASAVAEAARFAADVDRFVRLERLSLRSGHTERGLELELAGTLRIGQQAAALRLADARRLTDALPLREAMEQAVLADGRGGRAAGRAPSDPAWVRSSWVERSITATRLPGSTLLSAALHNTEHRVRGILGVLR